jgi:hypothetical protein
MKWFSVQKDSPNGQFLSSNICIWYS